MNGLGFLVWKLGSLTPIERTAATLRDMGAKWVSIKVSDGTNRYNLVDPKGNWIGWQQYLLEAILVLKEHGLSVGGWTFAYTWSIEAQAELAARLVKEYGLDHLLIDAEDVPALGCLWSAPGTADLANRYQRRLYNRFREIGIPFNFPVALCSYRQPLTNQPLFPVGAFINHPVNTHVSAQMYWMQAHNPGQQLRACVSEYNRVRKLPHVPIGASFREHGWEPTAQDIREFIQTAKELGCPGWGFWDLDEALQRKDWLDAMAETPIPPPPPPEKLPTVTAQKMRTLVGTLNVRSAIIPSYKYGRTPGVVYKPSKVWFQLGEGAVIESFETIVDGRNIWHRVGQQQYVAELYDDKAFLTSFA